MAIHFETTRGGLSTTYRDEGGSKWIWTREKFWLEQKLGRESLFPAGREALPAEFQFVEKVLGIIWWE